MESNFNEDEVKKGIKESQKRMKLENDILLSERKAALTWNIIFFIGILSTTIAISVFTKSDTFDFKDFFKNNSKDTLTVVSVITGITVSFLAGILGSYYKSKSLKKATAFDAQEYLKEIYLNRLESSNLNPQPQDK